VGWLRVKDKSRSKGIRGECLVDMRLDAVSDASCIPVWTCRVGADTHDPITNLGVSQSRSKHCNIRRVTCTSSMICCIVGCTGVVTYIYNQRPIAAQARHSYENLHHRRMIRMNAIAATGAYCRIIASTLIFRAALRYFSDSDRSEVDKWDIPAGEVVSKTS
jgi:hypothetical protein